VKLVYIKYVAVDIKFCSLITQGKTHGNTGGLMNSTNATTLHSDLLDRNWPGFVDRWSGEGSSQAHRVDPPDTATKTSLVFVSKPEQLAEALRRESPLIIALATLKAPDSLPKGTILYRAPHIGLAMSKVLPHFDRKTERFEKGIHPQSFVHPTAKLGKDVRVGAFASIGENVRVGDETLIGAHTVMERNAKIGARGILHPTVFVGADCELGDDVEVHPHTTIGSDGFGFAQDKEFRHHKLPQLGRVVIGDRVEIGANCAIDRAAFGETRIGSGTKFDNLCHVAHNVEIGENSVIAGGFFVAGSSKIGSRFMTGGSSVVSDHVKITDGVVLGGRSTVTNDIEKSGMYAGYPLEPLKDAMRTIANLSHLTRMRKQLSQVLKHLGMEEEK
jgi:UDP-3-O-[3-hydroxymyristoyl] glucosamine N-acyltransferase